MEGEYLTSYISPDNEEGSYRLENLVTKMKELEIENGTVGIISIPQKKWKQKENKGFKKLLMNQI